jgi:hypothetical protein
MTTPVLESSPGISTWDVLPTPYRPGVADFNGAALTDDPDAPPNPNEFPTANQMNTEALVLVSIGKMVPNARLSILAGATPSILYCTAAGSNVTSSSFVVTRNAAGDYSITWAQPSGTLTWSALTAYAVGTYMQPTSAATTGFYYEATAISGTGTSGTTQPTWPTTIGGTIVDNAGANQITWTCIGPITPMPAPVAQPDAYINLASGLDGVHAFSISAINIQNGVRVTTAQGSALTDINFTVSMY